MSLTEHKISVIRITNPFDPRQFVREELVWAPEKTLLDYFPTVGVNPFLIAINGKLIEDGQLGQTRLSKGDDLVVSPILLGGGGGGKNIFRLVAMIAISYFAPGMASALNSSMGSVLSAGSMGMSILSAGISMVGSMLVNALMPPAKPNTSSPARAGNDLNSSPTYGIDGAKNTSEEGAVVPVTYGTFRYGGNLIDSFIQNDGATQYLYVLYNCGEGPIGGIADIELNDQPIANFSDAEVEIRTGLADQAIMPWFDDIVQPRSVNQQLTTSYAFFNTIGEVDKLRFDVVATGGLTSTDQTTGITSPVTVELEFQYRKVGDTVWITVGGGGVDTVTTTYNYLTYDEAGQPISSTSTTLVPGDYVSNGRILRPYGVDPETGLPGVGASDMGYTSTTTTHVPSAEISDNSRSRVRRSFTTPLLPQGMYETRFRRVTANSTSDYVADDVFISDVNEIIIDDVTYKHTALLGLRIKLGDQLSDLPRVTHLNSGRIVRIWNVTTSAWEYWYTENPAWITLDMLTNRRFSAGIPDSRIDLEMFKEWAYFCAINGLTFNGVFDTAMNVWDALEHVTRAGRGRIVNVGTRFSVVIEREDEPMMMFSVANMIQGTFKQTWLPLADRANEIEITYFDKLDKYRQKTLRVYDTTKANLGVPPKPASFTLLGIVDAERAYNEATLHLNMNRYLLQTVQFDAPIEALACSVGSLVYVQHDMPQWGYSGRMDVGSTDTVVKLDRMVPMEVDKQYKLIVLYDTVLRASGTVTSVVGNSILLGGYTGVSSVKRLQAGGKDVTVTGIYQSGGDWGVTVDNPAGIAGGQSYQLFDTDSLEERDVVNVVSATSNLDTLTTTLALPAAPGQYVNWMFGEVNKVKKPFRVTNISGNADYHRTLSLLEYNASVYNTSGTAVPTTNYSALPTEIEPVTILGVDEAITRIGSVIRTRVTVRFESTQPTFKEGVVLVSRDGGAFLEVGRDPERVAIEGDDGEVLTFKVVAVDSVLGKAPVSSAPTITHTVFGKQANPADVTNFLINSSILSWDEVPDMDLAGYDIRYQPGINFSWGDAIPLHMGLVTENPFDITPFGLPVGQVTLMIKANDTGGRESVNANFIVTEFGDALVANVVQTFDQRASGFSGTKTNCTVVSGDLLATDASGLMWSANAATNMWTFDANLEWHATVWNAMIYDFSVLPTAAGSGSNMTLQYTVVGDTYTVEYRRNGPARMWLVPADYQWSVDSNNLMWGVAPEYGPWSGVVEVMAIEPYDFRVSVAQGPDRGTVSELTVTVDMPDINESFDDLVISSAGDTRLPLTKTYRVIKNVNATLQNDGNGAVGIRTVDKNPTLGPLLQAVDKTESIVQGLIDARIQGY